jgi:hypothetical protein
MTVRRVLLAGLASFVLAACSSSSATSTAPDAGYCESNGYLTPQGGACPKGTCMASGTSVACCGSVCASCEAKGLVSKQSDGTCPAGLCPSADVTATLQCCDSEPSVLPNGSDCTPSVSDSGAPETSLPEAASESGVVEAGTD